MSSKFIPQLQPLTHPNDNPTIVREACFQAGWHLRSASNWTYLDLFTGKEGEVTITGLIEALECKKARLSQKS